MSSLIPPRQELPIPDPQDVADDRDVARIARILSNLNEELFKLGFEEEYRSSCVAAATSEIIRKVFTDGH